MPDVPARWPKEVFLSHSSLDRPLAREVVGLLRRHGIRVWHSETDIVGAQQWHDEIGAALGRCDWFVVLISPASIKSRWVKHELPYALNDASYESRIVPVLCEPCDHKLLSWTLGSFQMIDLQGDRASGFRALLRVWGVGLVPLTD